MKNQTFCHKSLVKAAFFSYLTDPLFYAVTILTIGAVSFRFFFSARFFLRGTSSTDLRPFFTAIPSVAVLVIPLLVFRIRSLIQDTSLPFSDFSRFFTLAFSSLCAFFVPLVLLFSVPLGVSFFGDVEVGSLVAGYLTLLFYTFTAVCLCLFCSVLFSTALSLLVSVTALLCINTVHLLPLYVNLPSFLTFIFEKFSFAWHFNSASKGIIDSRDLTFYIGASFLFILLACLAQNRTSGRKTKALSVFFLSIIFVSSAVFFTRLYFRLDLSSSKIFSVSPVTTSLTDSLDDTVRITYFRSKELKNRYPSTNDVSEYLKSYASSSNRLTLHFENADSQRLSLLGIRGQQLKRESSSKTEYATVYSTVLIQYLDRQSIIDFVISPEHLEYDLTRRIQELVSEKERDIFLVSGNGRNLSEEYSYVSYYLKSQGFIPHNTPASSIEEVSLSHPKAQFLLFGSSALSYEESQALKTAVEKGSSAFIATSPYSSAVESDWNISTNYGDTLLPVLNAWGFAFDHALVNDISCFPLVLQSGEGADAAYETVNYPLWLSILPQDAAPSGLTLFWTSPLQLYEHTQPLLVTSQYAWLQNQSEGGKDLPFLINPFEIEKTASEAKKIPSRYVVAAVSEDLPVAVLSDQFFVHDLLTGFIASSESADSRNFQFLTKELLNLRGEGDLASLLDKDQKHSSLYKISDESLFHTLSVRILIIQFAVLPVLVVLCALVFALIRWRNNKKPLRVGEKTNEREGIND